MECGKRICRSHSYSNAVHTDGLRCWTTSCHHVWTTFCGGMQVITGGDWTAEKKTSQAAKSEQEEKEPVNGMSTVITSDPTIIQGHLASHWKVLRKFFVHSFAIVSNFFRAQFRQLPFQEFFLHFCSLKKKKGFLTSEDSSRAQQWFASEEANLISSLRCHTLCHCAEVYFLCEGQLANTAATSQEREAEKMPLTTNQGALFFFFTLPSSTDWGTSCKLALILGFHAPSSPLCFVVDCGKVRMVPVLWHHTWVSLTGEKISMTLTDRRSDLKGRGRKSWGYLLPPLTLPDTQPLIKPHSDRPEEQTELNPQTSRVPRMYRCELKKNCVGFGSGVGSPSEVVLTKTATCDSTELRES